MPHPKIIGVFFLDNFECDSRMFPYQSIRVMKPSIITVFVIIPEVEVQAWFLTRDSIDSNTQEQKQAASTWNWI